MESGEQRVHFPRLNTILKSLFARDLHYLEAITKNPSSDFVENLTNVKEVGIWAREIKRSFEDDERDGKSAKPAPSPLSRLDLISLRQVW